MQRLVLKRDGGWGRGSLRSKGLWTKKKTVFGTNGLFSVEDLLLGLPRKGGGRARQGCF